MAEQQEADRLAALAKAQVNVLNQGQQVHHLNHDDEDLGDEEFLNPQNPRFLGQKKEDLGAFTIPYTFGPLKVTKALCDLGTSINLMSLAVYKKLGLEDPTQKNMQLVMADRSVKQPVSILHDVLVKVADFILPADFVVLFYELDFDVPIILVRPLPATKRVLVGMELNELKFRFNEKEARFKIHSSMTQQHEDDFFLNH
ncbi:uncharacterized protein LOC107879130 [Capsicum annuum]|uniref:uncharacterized protein LOC107879130 n=1 Tax=Capsicum annuum TaxID=4072 RepID=UPI0007BEDDEF|nr:uncharacterized protein LOC107879130 [Capsicum annuum]